MSDETPILLTASEELIDKVARNLSMVEIFNRGGADEKLQAKREEGKDVEFIEDYKKLIDSCWASSTEEDEKEKAFFRSLAITALYTAGYDIPLSDQVLKALLV